MKMHPIYWAGAILYVGLLFLFMIGVVPESNLLNLLVAVGAPLLGLIGLILTYLRRRR